jgi:hypothetical protein
MPQLALTISAQVIVVRVGRIHGNGFAQVAEGQLVSCERQIININTSYEMRMHTLHFVEERTTHLINAVDWN